MEREGKEYQLHINRIESKGSVIGAVVLAFDITEAAFAERNRREFTANVSHELKTPLLALLALASHKEIDTSFLQLKQAVVLLMVIRPITGTLPFLID